MTSKRLALTKIATGGVVCGVAGSARADDMGLSSLGPPIEQSLIGWVTLFVAMVIAFFLRDTLQKRTWWRVLLGALILAEGKAFALDWAAIRLATPGTIESLENPVKVELALLPLLLPQNVGTFFCDPFALWPSVCTPSDDAHLGHKSPWSALESKWTTEESCAMADDSTRIARMKQEGWTIVPLQNDRATVCFSRAVLKKNSPSNR